MSGTDAEDLDVCPDCGEELWYDEEEGCWVCETCGIKDILTKSFGSTNPINLVKATIAALQNLRAQSEVERLRGVSLS